MDDLRTMTQFYLNWHSHTLLAIISLLWLLLGCRETPPSTETGDVKFVLDESQDSLNILEVNERIWQSNLVALTDIHTNRTLTFKYGVMMDAFNSFTGKMAGGVSKSPLGVFSVHFLDFCPPWYGGKGGTSSKFCSDTNLLGTYALWYKGQHNFGLHGRPNLSYHQTAFTDPQFNRHSSNGCVVAPQKHLVKFVDLLLQDPLVAHHPGVQKINQNRDDQGHYTSRTNVLVSLTDSENNKPPMLKDVVGDAIDYDIKVIVIDTGSAPWLNAIAKLPDQPLLSRYLSDAPRAFDPTKPARLVKACHLRQATTMYKTDGSQQLLEAGERLIAGAIKNHSPSNKDDPSQQEVFVFTQKSVPPTAHAWSGWLIDSSLLECASDYAWTDHSLNDFKHFFSLQQGATHEESQ